ncbi:MAG: thio(seleno)oxazole modification radical SAM maturase SbtM [Desulfovibrionales bacterium]
MTNLFPVSSRFLTQQVRDLLVRTKAPVSTWPDLLADHPEELGVPAYLADLLRLEQSMKDAQETVVAPHTSGTSLKINPSLDAIAVSWTGLPEFLQSENTDHEPQFGNETILVWTPPGSETVRVRPAGKNDLLALKIVSDDLNPTDLARENQIPVGVLDGALARAVGEGLLLSPASAITRRPPRMNASHASTDPFATARTFTLQWHITQQCDLACKHCYDRTDRVPLSLQNGLAVLDQFRDFCRTRFVTGQVSFTGGNPFLHPSFYEFYQAAFERHLQVAVLGNPVPEEWLDRIQVHTTPAFYQVSLEGLSEHNDAIRGTGHFQRTMDFLKLLRERGIPSSVMLTLTRANMDQVLPLGELLRGRTDGFSFNRLAAFGEGSSLDQADPVAYAAFCREYLQAARDNPVLNLKDNLLSIPLQEAGKDQFGGCTGFGCGAAFNFVSLLSDGELHACRKLPSSLGNIFETGLGDLYDSPLAERYRQGCTTCQGCSLFSVCGGCLAVTAGSGLDPFKDIDPFCPLRSSQS